MREGFSYMMREDIEDQEICMGKNSDLWGKGIKLSSEAVPSGTILNLTFLSAFKLNLPISCKT